MSSLLHMHLVSSSLYLLGYNFWVSIYICFERLYSSVACVHEMFLYSFHTLLYIAFVYVGGMIIIVLYSDYIIL